MQVLWIYGCIGVDSGQSLTLDFCSLSSAVDTSRPHWSKSSLYSVQRNVRLINRVDDLSTGSFVLKF